MTQRLIDGPTVELRKEQPYAAIPIEMDILDREVIAALVEEVYSWLKRKGIAPDGKPFCRYWVMGGVEEKFSLEVGVPIERMVAGNDRIVASFIPGGSYVSAVHHGNAALLDDSCYALEKWAEEEGLDLDKRYEEHTEIWNGRFEFYTANAADSNALYGKDVEIAFLLMRDDAA